MPIETRISGKYKSFDSPGPYIGRITNLLDTTYMGGLEVVLEKGHPGNTQIQEQTYIVQYLTPFYGVTDVRTEGNDPANFNDVQKSYGFWMVPPDIGTKVLCIFIDGDPNQGYWIGCIADRFQNQMIPGIAASQNVLLTDAQLKKYGEVTNLPVAEFLKRTIKPLISPNAQLKPVHPFADRLLEQGLLADNIRGVTSSSARREVPSSVFGISTPGPLDPTGKTTLIGYGKTNQKSQRISRLGGTQFVMDDGDAAGQNELVRLRTRTGHQILMHNSSDLIYIANSKGTAWIELTSNGKIDVYANDSVSIHSEADFNFRADRDINLEAGRNIHMAAGSNMETNVGGFYNLVISDYAKISIANDKDETVGGSSRFTAGDSINQSATRNIIATAGSGMSLSAGGNLNLTTDVNLNLSATGDILQTGYQIFLNGPPAEEAEKADDANPAPALPFYHLPNRVYSAGWSKGNFYQGPPIASIMQRVPTHEPWDQHENINPDLFSPARTDVTLIDRSASGIPANTSGAAPSNSADVIPGTCDPVYAKQISEPASQAGISALKEACKQLNITSPVAIASLLGIAGGESRWKTVQEGFNYSAARLLQVFPSVFKGDQALAQQYAGNPNNSLPEFLYGYQTAKGKGLGNTQPGDGAKFIGRGYIQLTGRANYARYGQILYQKQALNSPTALVDDPTLLLDPKIAALASAAYMLDRCKTSVTDPGYFEAAVRSVGFCTPDIHTTKLGFYQCFIGQLQGNSSNIQAPTPQTNSAGQPITSTVPPTTQSTTGPNPTT